MSSKLDWDVYTMFLYLANATMCIDDRSAEQVWNDMAYKLMEWHNIPRIELREVFNKFEMKFKELCADCNEEIEESVEEKPLCDACKK